MKNILGTLAASTLVVTLTAVGCSSGTGPNGTPHGGSGGATAGTLNTGGAGASAVTSGQGGNIGGNGDTTAPPTGGQTGPAATG